MTTATKPKTLIPFLKWAGGKTWVAPKLAEMFEPYKHTHTWVEPFCGGLGATLGVMPEKAILSDVNPHLINLYRQIADGLDHFGWTDSKELFEYVKKTFNRNNSVRNEELSEISELWQAYAFYYLNRTCYNGLCRFNLKGEFNTSYGKFKKPILNHDFSVYKEVFKNWDFFNLGYGDSLSIIKDREFDKHFVYADPPYDAGFTGYSGFFSWNDQVNLAEMLASLNCPVVASNKETERTVDLYKGLGFTVQIIEAPRRISCNGDRTAVREILATKNI